MTTTETGTFDEAELVRRAKSGDTSAYSELVTKYEGKVFRLAKNITQNDEDAEDVLQDAFLKAYEHLDNFQEQSKFYTWLVRIAVNEALMRLRKRKTDRTVPLDEPVDTGEETVAREIAGKTLRTVKMQDAPPMQNTIVAYRRRDAGKPEGIVAAFLELLETK